MSVSGGGCEVHRMDVNTHWVNCPGRHGSVGVLLTYLIVFLGKAKRGIFHLLVHFLPKPATSSNGPGQRWEPDTQAGSLMWMAGTIHMEPLCVTSQDEMGCGCPSRGQIPTPFGVFGETLLPEAGCWMPDWRTVNLCVLSCLQSLLSPPPWGFWNPVALAQKPTNSSLWRPR